DSDNDGGVSDSASEYSDDDTLPVVDFNFPPPIEEGDGDVPVSQYWQRYYHQVPGAYRADASPPGSSIRNVWRDPPTPNPSEERDVVYLFPVIDFSGLIFNE